MSSFTTPLIVEAQDDGCTWKLIQPFEYEIGVLGSGAKILVPAGFVTDFASVPQIFWNILPPWGQYGKAAVLHDFLYKTQPVTRALCDSIFLEAMYSLSVPYWKRIAIYLGVRLGGMKAWEGHSEELNNFKNQ